MSHAQVLGPVQIRTAERAVDLGPPKRRMVFAALAVDVGRPVSVGTLIRRVWGAEPPADARNALYVHVMHLRRALAALPADTAAAARPAVRRDANGYRLEVDPEWIDLHRFNRLIEAARAVCDDAGRHTAVLHEALDLWQGTPFAGLSSPWLSEVRDDLRERRLNAVLGWADSELRLGNPQPILARVPALLVEHPLVEPLVGVLMRALHAAGRTAEALDRYASTCRRLADDLGVDPSAELRDLHLKLLTGGPGVPRAAEVAGICPTARAGAARRPDRPGPPALAAVASPRQLPPAPVPFVGRVRQLRTLDGVTGLAVISGMAGVGKTALAVHWAHGAADQFPDGQLYVNLHGWGDTPALTPLDALTHLLVALGTPPHQVPANEQLASAMFRTAAAGRHLLIVLDNANRADQVRPLLPGGPGCLVLVTSRERLTGLVARDCAAELPLDVLDLENAIALVDSLLSGRRREARDLAQACGGLPLALRIAGASAVGTTAAGLEQLLDRLRSDRRLDALSVRADAHAAVETAFQHSYAALDQGQRRLFRLLGELPVTEFGAGLARWLTDDAEDAVDRLVDAHLVTKRAAGRYAMHDLLRNYARQRAAAEESAAGRLSVIHRCYQWYLDRAQAASQILYPQLVRLCPDAPPVFKSAEAALGWVQTEQAQLVEAVAAAAEGGEPAIAWLLADALRGHFLTTRALTTWLKVCRIGLAAARGQGDLRAQAAMQFGLAQALAAGGGHREAISTCQKAVRLSVAAGWPAGRSAALTILGVQHSRLGHTEKALEYTAEALAVSRANGKPSSVAVNLNNLASMNMLLGRLGPARDQLTEAMRLHRAAGTLRGLASVLVNLGTLGYREGRLDLAERRLRESHAIYRDLSDREGAATALSQLALVQRLTGRSAEALRSAQTALGLIRGTGDPNTEALALTSLAAERRHAHPRLAEAYYQRSLRLARTARDRQATCTALIGLADAYLCTHRPEDAASTAAQALELARTASYPQFEGQALALLARVHLGPGDTTTAVRLAGEAVDLHRRAGHRLDLAHSLAVQREALSASRPPAPATAPQTRPRLQEPHETLSTA
ncbi:AfsR/SARP family transcriptional regulator [Streptomyces yanii]|uniref:BTAD domain-containing putative transcriptional regulator n=1 Tax=Streptomyces yanii TaxID=78510 RepID=A0ABV5R9G3_9ACTN